jgi:hypothetical protein
METAGEELSRLRAENACLKQLLTSNDAQLSSVVASNAALLACKDELLGTKDELLASRAAELQRSQVLLQPSTAIPEVNLAAGDSSKRQRLHDSSVPPLDRDDILSHVFTFVGGGDHLYTGAVSRRWRDRYMQYCVQRRSKRQKKFVTRHRNVLMAESRLRLALSSGLTIEGWSFDTPSHADLICKHSLEPEKVITLLRVHGVPWSSELCSGAAYFNKLTLLQWMHAHACPWVEKMLLYFAVARGSIAMLHWLLTVTSPWSSDVKQAMLSVAACENTLTAVQWLRSHGAEWPTSFLVQTKDADTKRRMCWSLSAVQWALAHGSGWREWKCEDYDAAKYRAVDQHQATDVLEWAHANGCPCTCGHAQQQQQEQQ